MLCLAGLTPRLRDGRRERSEFFQPQFNPFVAEEVNPSAADAGPEQAETPVLPEPERVADHGFPGGGPGPAPRGADSLPGAHRFGRQDGPEEPSASVHPSEAGDQWEDGLPGVPGCLSSAPTPEVTADPQRGVGGLPEIPREWYSDSARAAAAAPPTFS